ncbi:hypothetical protein FKW77_007249 [Venturia effusa]|uniref:YDG domain-containing protein n=1 Tax=Venturia effusa TaxID=50376 RepID=A0A517L5Q3_9PEZI|nr:hypothetical protein FKW77_007249 [Venturia effusa]
MDRPRPTLLVYDPNKRLDDAAREQLVEERYARMKAAITARKEREAEAEREQRRKSLAPHWDDPSDDELDVSKDVVSLEVGQAEKQTSSKQEAAPDPLQIEEKAAHEQSSNPSKVPVPANNPQSKSKNTSASRPANNILNLSIDTHKKRSYDDMSNSSSSGKDSRHPSPMTEPVPSVASPVATMSPKDISSGLASLPRISKRRKTSLSEQVSPASNASNGHNFGVAPLPDWYLKAVVMPKGISPALTSAIRRTTTQFDKLKENMKICITTKDSQAQTAALRQVSDLLHTLEFTKIPHAHCLAHKKMLHEGQGLKRIADFQDGPSYNFPWYLRADAQELYTKWRARDWDPDMFRGITNMVKGPMKNKGQAIDPKFKKDWRFFGEGQFVAGQWWPMQLCAVRDGAHGSAQAGIAGIKTTDASPGGATSIVLSEGHKEDIDQGEEIWYCGTEAKIGDNEPTASTKLMLESVASNKPVRVMRSSSLPVTNKYRPVKGFRYDGLYEVLDSQLIDKLKHHHLFHLRRIPGQINLRCEGEAARPTARELEELESEMKKYGRRGSFE